jgi:hypothetical protein
MAEGAAAFFNHTFSGSNSLDNHAKTFSICGAMNNMIILVIPFTGDVR